MGAREKREAQQRGMRYGCHVELDEDQTPDDCVMDYGDLDGCVYARRHKTREACRYWQPIDAKVVP